ncbi:MAG: tetratricopeptide repeat protein [Bacteroidetes bacterium]|jgi:serine/threonine-protein kinase|nr:tetratricopeptide repeat protein [Bacteroidota bacterium]
MDDLNWNKVETIIDELLQLPEDQHATYIKEKCGDNEKLKGEVTDFLESIYESEGWLEEQKVYREQLLSEIADDLGTITMGYSLIGKEIGSYTIREKIAEGGMGGVYLAERSDEELDHKVAIKIIKHGRASADNLRRFKREQQILAGMNHPNIARFFNSGTTSDGFPYIIMEYIDGMPITDYCEKNECTIEEKIDLFKKVLEAVRYAHENLVIHRDLKPGNIFIDNTGHVKILDFGISKLMEEESEDITQTGSRILTLRYAAPEQIRQKNITMATDLYALGILFYQLISGKDPFDIDDLSRFETEQVILHEEPPRPSSRTEHASRKRKLTGDLDAIAIKAIRKESDQRYRVANDFLRDLENYELGIPVSAHTDSLRYRSKKFVERHKKGIYVTSGVLILIIAITAYYTNRIAQERDYAQLEAERATEVTDFMVSMLELNNPSENSGNEITINDALNRGIGLVEQRDISPLNRATLLGTIGSIQFNNGDVDQAGITLEQAMTLLTDSVDRHTEKSLTIGTEYAEWQETVGNTEEAEHYFQLTDSLFQASNLRNSVEYIDHQLNYSDFLMELGNHQEALNILSSLDTRLFQNFDRSNSANIDLLANVYNNRGRAFKNMGQNQQALENLEQALSLKLQVFDEDNARIATLYHNMGVVYATVSQFQEAKERAEKAYEIRMKVFNPDHQLVGSTLHLLSNIETALGNYDQAFDYIEQSIEINRKQHGATHFRYALAIREYAKVLSQTGYHEEALEQIDRAASIIENNYGTDHPYYGYMMFTHGEVCYNAEDYSNAVKYGDLGLAIFTKNFGENHPNVGRAYANQGKYSLKIQQFSLADSLLTKSVQILEQHFDTSNAFLVEADSLLQISLQHQIN